VAGTPPQGLRARLRRLLVLDDDPAALVAAAPPVPVRAIVRRFWPYARPYRATLLVVLGLAALGPVIDAATVWMFKVVVDDVLVPRDFGLFAWVAAAYLGLVLLDGIVSFADDYLSTSVAERFLLRLRTDVFRHLHRLSPTLHDRRRLGDTMSRVTGDVAAIEGFVLSGVVDVGQAEIEQHEVVLGRRERVGAGLDVGHLEALAPEPLDQRLGDGVLVLDQQDPLPTIISLSSRGFQRPYRPLDEPSTADGARPSPLGP
jgi:ABC-type multidrug transport system fused ATPase/permease subunit